MFDNCDSLRETVERDCFGSLNVVRIQAGERSTTIEASEESGVETISSGLLNLVTAFASKVEIIVFLLIGRLSFTSTSRRAEGTST